MKIGKALAGFGIATMFVVGAAANADVMLNEIRIDQPGADLDEYFELAGNPGESLNGLWYIVIGDGSGGSGWVESALDLTGYAVAGDGFFLAAEVDDPFGAPADLLVAENLLNFENSDNVTHVLVSNFSGTLDMDLDTDDDGVLDVTPWDSWLDSIALVKDPIGGDKYYGDNTIGPDGSFVPGHVYRFPDGNGQWYIGQFDPVGGQDTPGEGNVPTPGSLVLLGAGLAIGGFRRRRR